MSLTNPKGKLESCHADLQRLVKKLAETMDIIVVYGYRTKEEQDAAFASGNSKLKWPKSGHNSSPSKAVDLAPYKEGKLDWTDLQGFKDMQKEARKIAASMGIKLKPLISWDLPHLELV
jgi:peptidoglycan LD-endopeptidase CwlK